MCGHLLTQRATPEPNAQEGTDNAIIAGTRPKRKAARRASIGIGNDHIGTVNGLRGKEGTGAWGIIINAATPTTLVEASGAIL